MRFKIASAVIATAVTAWLGATVALADPQPQSFTYQGELRSGASLAQGPHDLRFEMLDGSDQVLQVLCAEGVDVVNGRFTVLLNPGAEFPNLLGELRSVRVLVRPETGLACDDGTGFVALSPTQPFTRTPLASRANIADRASTADSLGGFAPAYFSNAANLTGTVPDSALSLNIPRLDAFNYFRGVHAFDSIQTGVLLCPGTGGGLRMSQNGGAVTMLLGAASNSASLLAIGSSVAGGSGNTITDAANSVIAGGTNSTITSTPQLLTYNAVIAGGAANNAAGVASVIGGGLLNVVAREGATIAGGHHNHARGRFSFIGGGGPGSDGSPTSTNNRAIDNYTTIAGGADNRAGIDDADLSNGRFATIGGGESNRAIANHATIAGGSGNQAQSQFSTVGGGVNNIANGGGFATIAGGSENEATGFVATVAGGDFNDATGARSAIGGGSGNQATADFATVSGGISNIASGPYSIVAGGLLNTASGISSFAGGTRARALHNGAFVWADTSYGSDFVQSTAPNQFIALASGGVQFRGAGNATRLAIDPAGNVSVPGTLNAGNIGFTAPRTSYKSYPAGAFVGGTYSDEIARRNGFALERIAGAGGSQMTLHVPIDLPHGSEITEVLVYCKDTDASRRLRFWFTSTALPSQVATIVRNVTTAGLNGPTLSVNVTPPQPYVVNNAAGSLEFVVLAEAESGAGQVFDNWAGGLEIIGLRITYTVTSATP